MASINFEGVGRVFPEGSVAPGIFDLDVEDGELVVLVGPSGSGKSVRLGVDPERMQFFDPHGERTLAA